MTTGYGSRGYNAVDAFWGMLEPKGYCDLYWVD